MISLHKIITDGTLEEDEITEKYRDDFVYVWGESASKTEPIYTAPWTVFTKLYMPLSLPVLTTVGLFMVVNDWNSFLDGSIYMKSNHVPLATYLKSMITMPDINGE